MNKQNMAYAYNGIFSVLKRKEILTHAITWMNLEDIMLTQVSQSQKNKYYIIPLYKIPRVV